MAKIVKRSVKQNLSEGCHKTDDMTAPIQPALDGSIPVAPATTSRCQSEDYEAWLAEVWPKFIAVAAAGRTFTCYSVADAHKLPDPPNPQAHWGRLMTLLRDEGYIRTAGWACSDRPTTHHSGVRTWKGTAAARREVAA
ncbi:hypothetical protein ACWCXC_31810 [Streptomyces sp. NPDC001515]